VKKAEKQLRISRSNLAIMVKAGRDQYEMARLCGTYPQRIIRLIREFKLEGIK
jgi:hypothetical protein